MSPSAQPALETFEFKRQKQFLNGKVTASFEAIGVSDPAVLAAIALNTEFPEGDITLGKYGLKAGTASPVIFKTGAGPVSFGAAASVFGEFGVYAKGSKLVVDLKKGPLAALPDFKLPEVTGRRYALLASGYDISAKVSAAIALGPVPVTAKLDAKSKGFLGVVSAIEDGTGARDAIAKTIDGLVPPSLLRNPDQLPAGSWVIAEIEGSVGVSIGTQLGLDFNWVREAQLEGLEGDIGLKLQTAISASIGFQAAGSWMVVVARESNDPVLRLQLFRMASRSLNVMFDAKVTAKLETGILPAKADDLIRGLLGVHGAQVMNYIGAVEKWTDPKTSLNELLAAEGIAAAKGLIAEIGGVTVDELVAKAEQVQQRVTAFIAAWKDLPHRVAAEVLSLVDANTPIEPVREFVGKLAAVPNAEGLLGLLRDKLNAPQFFPDAVTRLLEAIGGGGVLTVANQPLDEVRTVAGKILKLLDGSALEDALGRLAGYLKGPLSPDRLEELVAKADVKKLEPLLQDKLAKFLGVDNPAMLEVEKVRQTLGLLLRKRQEFYSKAVEALKKSYSASLTASFSSTTKSTAHIDAVFDFRGNPAGLSELLGQAIGGDFDALLTQTHPGVTLNLGQLTHGIQRKTNVELTLPFLSRSFSHWNESLASLEAMEDGGRVLVYGLEAKDTVVTNQRNSTLSLGMTVATRPGAQALFVHEAPPLEFSYQLRQYLPRLDQSDVEHQLVPLIQSYFPTRVNAQTIERYTASLNERTEALIPNTPDYYGDALFALECTFASDDAAKMGAVWLGLGTKPGDASYQQMSLAVQKIVKRLTHDCYFQTPDRYLDLNTAYVLLAWAAIPELNNKEGQLHWDWMSPGLRRAMLSHPNTLSQMKVLLGRASARLSAHTKLAGNAQFFRPLDAKKILDNVDVDDPRFKGLLFSEATMVEGIFQAGKSIAQFVKKSKDKPSQAVKHLAQFGSKLTDVVNSGPASVYLGSLARPLGTAVYVEALRGLSQGTVALTPLSVARLGVINASLEFSPKEFLDTGKFPEADLLLSDQICS